MVHGRGMRLFPDRTAGACVYFRSISDRAGACVYNRFGSAAGACVYIRFGRPEHASISGSDGRSMRLYRMDRTAGACVYIGIGWPEHASISGSDGRSMRLYRDRIGRSMRLYRDRMAGACVYIGIGRPEHACQETPTFTHLGDTYFYALMVLEGRAASGVSEGAALGRRGVSARGAARRRERSDRSAAAPRAETSARAGRGVTPRVMPGIPLRSHSSHASRSERRSSAAGTRRRSPSSFSR